jgi:hypothetical protein
VDAWDRQHWTADRAARQSRAALDPLRRAAIGEMKMNEQATKLETAESNLQTTDGGRKPGHGKGSGSRREDNLHGWGRHCRYGTHG